MRAVLQGSHPWRGGDLGGLLGWGLRRRSLGNVEFVVLLSLVEIDGEFPYAQRREACDLRLFGPVGPYEASVSVLVGTGLCEVSEGQ